MATVTVVGSDKVSPIYDETGLWKIWSYHEIWLGQVGAKHYVPKVNDWVTVPETGEMYIVDHLDPVTLIPTLRSIKLAATNTDLTDEEVLFGIGVGSDPKTKFALLNDSVFPYVMQLDQRFTVSANLSSYARVFLGVDTNLETGTVLSKVYDASGNYIGDKVPLQLVKVNSHTNYSSYSVKRFNTTQKIKDGEKVTVVIYGDDGIVSSRTQFLVENTDLIADLNTESAYIVGIDLESSFMSPTVPNQIDFPLNLPLDTLDLMGVVKYTDKTLRLPIDGSKFIMSGLDGMMSSIPSQPIDLVLTYILSEGETAYSIDGVNQDRITKGYKLKTSNVNLSVAVKLFGYPVWVSEAEGYTMKWWLYNKARNVWFDATNYVKFNDSHGAFNPKLYGYVQRKSVSVNLRDVSSTFIPFLHNQIVDIVLLDKATDGKDCWKMSSEANGVYFGEGIYARRVNALGMVTFKADFETYEDWLAAYYTKTLPLYDSTSEHGAPAPTHFIVKVGTTETEWTMDYWDKNIVIADNVQNYATASIRFIKRQIEGDLHLSVAAVLVRPSL